MKNNIYHVFPDEEPFSEKNGGAISRWGANVLRDDSKTIIICPSADNSWGFPDEQIRVSFLLRLYGKNKYLRQAIRQSLFLLRRILTDKLQDVKPGDVLWVQNDRKHAAALLPFAKKKKAILVLHMHNSLPTYTAKKVINALKEIQIVCCSNFLRKESQKNFPCLQNFQVLLNGSDETLFYPLIHDYKYVHNAPLKILFAGRLVKEKGVHVLLEAMHLLQQRNVLAQALIVGSARFGAFYTNAYTKNLYKKSSSNVKFMGYCSGLNLAQIFRDSDIYVAPSIWNDPFPLSVLEAMASGLPIVASEVGGISEQLRYGGGLLITPNNPILLADTLQKLLESASLRKQISVKARKAFLENFTWKTVQKNYQKILQSLMYSTQGETKR